MNYGLILCLEHINANNMKAGDFAIWNVLSNFAAEMIRQALQNAFSY